MGVRPDILTFGESWFFFSPGLATRIHMEVTEGEVEYSSKTC
jgi:hypothetical protein